MDSPKENETPGAGAVAMLSLDGPVEGAKENLKQTDGPMVTDPLGEIEGNSTSLIEDKKQDPNKALGSNFEPEGACKISSSVQKKSDKDDKRDDNDDVIDGAGIGHLPAKENSQPDGHKEELIQEVKAVQNPEAPMLCSNCSQKKVMNERNQSKQEAKNGGVRMDPGLSGVNVQGGGPQTLPDLGGSFVDSDVESRAFKDGMILSELAGLKRQLEFCMAAVKSAYNTMERLEETVSSGSRFAEIRSTVLPPLSPVDASGGQEAGEKLVVAAEVVSCEPRVNSLSEQLDILMSKARLEGDKVDSSKGTAGNVDGEKWKQRNSVKEGKSVKGGEEHSECTVEQEEIDTSAGWDVPVKTPQVKFADQRSFGGPMEDKKFEDQVNDEVKSAVSYDGPPGLNSKAASVRSNNSGGSGRRGGRGNPRSETGSHRSSRHNRSDDFQQPNPWALGPMPPQPGRRGGWANGGGRFPDQSRQFHEQHIGGPPPYRSEGRQYMDPGPPPIEGRPGYGRHGRYSNPGRGYQDDGGSRGVWVGGPITEKQSPPADENKHRDGEDGNNHKDKKDKKDQKEDVSGWGVPENDDNGGGWDDGWGDSGASSYAQKDCDYWGDRAQDDYDYGGGYGDDWDQSYNRGGGGVGRAFGRGYSNRDKGWNCNMGGDDGWNMGGGDGW